MKCIKLKRFLSILLVVTMLVSMNTTAFANTDLKINYSTKESTANIIITDDGVYLKGDYYTKAEFEELLKKAELVKSTNSSNTRMAAPAVVYFIPGIGEIAFAGTVIIVAGYGAVKAGSWLYDTITNWLSNSSAREIAQVRAQIPSRLRDKNGDVDLGKFDQKVKNDNGTTYKEKKGWTIDKDTANHGGRKWKLKDKSGNRVASLGENGEVLGK